jgi:large subunit ribosomal protein L29
VKKGDRDFIHEISLQELVERIANEELMYQKTRFRHSVSAIENPLTIRQMRRNIARLKTELGKRQRADQTKK